MPFYFLLLKPSLMFASFQTPVYSQVCMHPATRYRALITNSTKWRRLIRIWFIFTHFSISKPTTLISFSLEMSTGFECLSTRMFYSVNLDGRQESMTNIQLQLPSKRLAVRHSWYTVILRTEICYLNCLHCTANTQSAVENISFY